MSFLDKNNSDYISARLTQRGRRAIANGNFNISYFGIGDSEYDYSGSSYQNVLAPLDKNTNIKYPFKYDSSTSSTTYGIPVTGSTYEIVKNRMGSAGVISGNTISSLVVTGAMSGLTGTNTLTVTVPSGKSFRDSQFVTLVLNGISSQTISSYGNNFTYKIIGHSGNTTTEIITLDRQTPNLSTLTGNFYLVANNWKIEFPNDANPNCYPIMPLYSEKHDPWKMDIVWGRKPVGFGSGDDNYTTFTGSNKLSVKEFLGYNSVSGQTFTNVTGGTITGSYFLNSFNERVEVLPNEQNSIAILHYSENGDIINDPDRFFKYDDYLTTGDTYFEIYNPFMYYHRNTGATIGAKFHMGTEIKHVVSSKNPNKSSIFYNELLDEQNKPVGKVFPYNKVIVFDDEEIVAVLDSKSNRKYTLPSPKLEVTHTTDGTYLHDGTSGKTVYITYVLKYTDDLKLNALPCNYINKIKSTSSTNVAIKFSGSTAFNFLQTSAGNSLKSGTVANKLYILVQVTDNNTQPVSNAWRMIDKTPTLVNGFITPSSLNGHTVTITRAEYDSASGNLFSMSGHTGQSYSGVQGQFGDRQPFAGSIKVTRESTIEEMKFLINLPNGKFNISQNPTYRSGNPVITEIALLDSSKEALVMGKTAIPITRTGDQVFAVKLDF